MTRIFAHRGASATAPENTLEAFALAITQGADGVELDVHLSQDGELVVIHDETIDRTSNGSGLVSEMTVERLKSYRYNAGMDGYPDATIPTLREVFALIKPSSLHVNVELKTDKLHYDGIEEKCLRLAAECGMTERVLYSSFNHYSLVRVKEIDKRLPCGLLYEAVTLAMPWRYAKDLGMDALHPEFPQIFDIPDYVERAHAAGILVNPWTVNEEQNIRAVIGAGADIIITNYPDRAIAILKEKAR